MTETARTVLVTGAARRIGRVIALEMAMAGWNVALHFHTSQSEAQETAEHVKALGRQVCLVQTDLADPAAVEKLVPRAIAEVGPLAALVNNASLFERDENDPDGTLHMAINAQAPGRLSELFARQLPQTATGAIVNILDSTPIPPFLGAYASSKKALSALTLDLARGLAPRVRVNAVMPGPTLINRRESPEHFERLKSGNLLGVETPPEAVAATVRFLIENPVITGVLLPVDGGAHLITRSA